MIQACGEQFGNDDSLYVFFTGRQMKGYAADHFQWLNTAHALQGQSIFLRDTGNNYYFGRSLLRDMLRLYVEKFNGRVVFAGVSMGGWAAIDYAFDCKPDKVIAFSPSPPIKNSFTVSENTHIYFCKDSIKRIGINGLNDRQSAELFKGATFHEVDGDIHDVQLILKEQGALEGILKHAN